MEKMFFLHQTVRTVDLAACADGGPGNAQPDEDLYDGEFASERATVENFWEEETEGASPEQIAATERRLAVVLPEMLKALYRRSNGGFARFTEAQRLGAPIFRWGRGHRAIPSLKLPPLAEIKTLDEIDREMTVGTMRLYPKTPEGAERMICLSCSDTHATVLDYRKGPKSPEVLILIVGFTSSAGQIKARYKSFDAFMRDLRRM
jgi:hypothetical protein